MECTKKFSKLTKKSIPEAGGKGASLGEMTNAKIPVPPGFVVLADTFERFLEEADIVDDIQAELDKVNYEDTNSIDRASNVIRAIIKKTKTPQDIQSVILNSFQNLGAKFVAVRSSATAEDSKTASWAGELETYLFVTKKNLLEQVKTCWSSLFTPRAIFYRHEKKLLNTKVSVAVVVQKMINSEVSGITFTVHPVTKDYNQMIIEAGYGLGEAIVSGSITPDSYIIDKKDELILDVSIAKQEKMMIIKSATGGLKTISVPKAKQEKQKLSGPKIMELAALCAKIEKHYKHPQDIEWALEKGKLYILQSRPITTL
ncbi:MAG: PEP/pyruvate-binding domain-containing protein [bacterium]|nr:PEP/pyruvate-binding domain-containing protein [bacterium]